jgi:hypothetical protein
LSQGASFSVACSVQVKLKEQDSDRDGKKFHLGALLVDWKPSIVPLPTEARACLDQLHGINGHGPLLTESPSTIRFAGPKYYIEKAPFEATLLQLPTHPRVLTPFQIGFCIENKTQHFQDLALEVADFPEDECILISGLLKEKLRLSPYGKRELSYYILTSKAGPISLPPVLISSSRYKTWVVNDVGASLPKLYVFP